MTCDHRDEDKLGVRWACVRESGHQPPHRSVPVRGHSPTPLASGRSDRAGCDSNEADSEPEVVVCGLCGMREAQTGHTACRSCA